MLVSVQDDLWLGHCKDDPVRPHIPLAWRIQNGREVFALFEDQYAEAAPVTMEGPRAIICVAYTHGVAITEQDLENTAAPNTAMFYTVWSYNRGAGRQIVNTLAQHIKQSRSEIKRWVTLSPLTEMAKRFHTNNGAQLHSVHDTCQVFEYTHLMTV